MEYKVMLEKCKEHLGEQLYGVLEPWSSPLMKQKLGLLVFMTGLAALILLISKLYWQPLVLIAAAGMLIPYAKSSVQRQYKKELVEKILPLVNDHELLWLNFVYPKKAKKFRIDTSLILPSSGELNLVHPKKTIKIKPIRLERDSRSEIKETTMKALAFVKKEGTSQGLHNFIVGFQDSSSANKHLGRLSGENPSAKRLPENKLVERMGNDFRYIPWKFVLIDEFENRLPGEENKIIEELLAQAFEEHLDSYYPEKEKMTPWEKLRWNFRERMKAKQV